MEKTEDITKLPEYILPSWAYHVLKWLALVALPLVAVVYPQLGAIWGWPYGGEVAQTCSIAGLAVGVLIGTSQLKATVTSAGQGE